MKGPMGHPSRTGSGWITLCYLLAFLTILAVYSVFRSTPSHLHGSDDSGLTTTTNFGLSSSLDNRLHPVAISQPHDTDRRNTYDGTLPSVISGSFDPEALGCTLFHEFDNEEERKEWIDVLAHGRIASVSYLVMRGAVAKKYVVLFESGHVAVAKPVQAGGYLPTLFFGGGRGLSPREVEADGITAPVAMPALPYHNHDLDHYRRTEWAYQGWAELASYYLDQLLGTNLKPPTAGRTIRKAVLYEFDPSWHGLFARLWPVTYDVPVAMVAWVSGLKRAAPTSDIAMQLLRPLSSAHSTIVDTTAAVGNDGNSGGDGGDDNDQSDRSGVADDAALQYSDVLLFDFLVGDHDRLNGHNWRQSQDGRVVAWDSGMGWLYGPVGRKSDLDILCVGKTVHHSREKRKREEEAEGGVCPRICQFRGSIVRRLRELVGQSSANNRSGADNKTARGKAWFELREEIRSARSRRIRSGRRAVDDEGLNDSNNANAKNNNNIGSGKGNGNNRDGGNANYGNLARVYRDLVRKSDVLYPIFHYAMFHRRQGEGTFRFLPKLFFNGLQAKVEQLLNHIDEHC